MPRSTKVPPDMVSDARKYWSSGTSSDTSINGHIKTRGYGCGSLIERGQEYIFRLCGLLTDFEHCSLLYIRLEGSGED